MFHPPVWHPGSSCHILSTNSSAPHKPSAALVESLMGFQFNSVGGGTKTRCPVTLHMQYDPTAASPRCFLLSSRAPEEGRGGMLPISLAELQVCKRMLWKTRSNMCTCIL